MASTGYVARKAIPRSAPEAQGIPSGAISAFLDAANAQAEANHSQELHSLMVVRHGTVVAEGWWEPYKPALQHMLFSLSKSFSSTAIGFAVTEGLLTVDDTVLSFFPGDAPADVSANLAAMRVKHLLAMSTGHAGDRMEYMYKDPEGNWPRGFLSAPVEHEPGTHFAYDTAASYMLSAIVQKLTGQTLVAYLTPRLFEPLGIEGATWACDPRGVNLGGFGLDVRTEDIAKLGQLYLQLGVWEGKQLLPASWVEEATSAHTPNGTDYTNDWQNGYCYQFWRSQHGAYRGDGAFGQYCVVMPDQDAVVAITSGVADMQAVLTLIWDILLPAMAGGCLPANPNGDEALRAKLGALTLRAGAPAGAAPEAGAASGVMGRWFAMEKNYLGIEGARLDLVEAGKPDAGFQLTVSGAFGEHTARLTPGSWSEPVDLPEPGPGGRVQSVSLAGGWSAAGEPVVRVQYIATPFCNTFTLRLEGDALVADQSRNVDFGPTELPSLRGRAGAGL